MTKRRRNAHTHVLLIGIVVVLCLFVSSHASSSLAVQAQAETPIAQPFRGYYWQHEGMRVLGLVQSRLVDVAGLPGQYFEKGRLEDHRHVAADPTWRFAYGRLTAELSAQAPTLLIGNTTVTYGDLLDRGAERFAAPVGFTGGTLPVAEGEFVPADPLLQPAPGYIVPPQFWAYINRADLFPTGWLHTHGLPLTNAFSVETVKNNQPRMITMQAFERTILTYDPQNPVEWQVERANIGTDALLARGQMPLRLEPVPPRYVFPVESAACEYGRYHHDYPAADIFCPLGSTVVAPTDGVVDFVSTVDLWDPATNRPEQRSGLAVAIIGDDGVRYYGSHLDAVADGIVPGMRVTVGQPLGQLGRSGNARSTPPHLHFGISRPTTPDDWEVRRGEIAPYEYLKAWERGEMVTPEL